MIETLIVDDEINVGRVLQHILKRSGYRCTIALNSAEARDRLEEQSFDLVLLDIIMPGESGLGLLQYLQATYPDTAVVMISSIDNPEVAAKALELGAFGYLPKPFDTNEVLINLASAVRRRQLEIENRDHRQKLTELVEQRTAALIASETRHQALLGALPDPVIAYDSEGRATYVNEAFEKTFGWTRDEVLGRPIDFVPAEEREKTSEGWQRIFAGEDVILETKRLTKDGRVLDILVRGAVTRDQDGQVTESVVVIKDITERKQAEEEVRREKEFRTAVLNAMSDAISIINVDDLTIAWANQAFFEEVGLSAEQVIGQPCYQVTHGLSKPCQPPNDPCPLQATVKSGCRFTDEHLHFRSDGEGFYADISTNPLGDETGRVVQVVHVARDVTDRKKAEEALRESEERYRDILRNIEEAYYEVDLKGNLTFFNDSLGRLYGYTSDELMGMNYRRYMDEDNAPEVFRTFNQVHTTGQPARGFGWEIVRKDGTRGFAEASVTQIQDADG